VIISNNICLNTLFVDLFYYVESDELR